MHTQLSPLIIILDDAKHDPAFILSEACAAGARCFIWRARHLSPNTYYDKARALAEIATAYQATLLTHERVDIMQALALEGVHLPGDGLPIEAVRAVIGRDRIVGKSLHHAHEFKDSVAIKALSYATISPVFSPTSKPQDTRDTLGIEGLARIVQAAKGLPIFALGGITPEHVPACLEAGASGIVVLGGISHADDPYTATLAYLEHT